MATKFKFEIESDGLTVEQSQAFSDFVKSLGATTVEHSQAFSTFVKSLGMATEALQPLQDETQQKSMEVPGPVKKKRASRAKVDGVISETPMQIDARNMDVVEEPQAEEVQAEEVQAEEVQAEEPQAEEAQAEESKTSAYSVQDVRDRVKEKQGKWRTSIKAELERLGSSSVSLLDPAHFEEFCNFMDNLA